MKSEIAYATTARTKNRSVDKPRSKTNRLPTSMALAGLMFILLAAGCTQTLDSTASLNTPSLLVIGIDGAEWDVIDPLLERGQLPALARLLEHNVRSF